MDPNNQPVQNTDTTSTPTPAAPIISAAPEYSTQPQPVVASPAGANFDYASRSDRLGAAIVDSILIALIALPIAFIIAFIEVLITGSNDALPEPLYFLIIFAVIFFAYWIVRVRPVIKDGHTIGMKQLKIRVVKDDGTPVSANTVWGREFLLSFVGGITSLFYIFVLPILFTAKRQGIHDMAFKTVVIKDFGQPQSPAQPITAAPQPQQAVAQPLTSPSRSKNTTKIIIVVAILLFILVPIIMSATSFVNKELNKDKRADSSQYSKKNSSNLIERSAGSDGRSVSVLVPNGWKNSFTRGRDNEKNYISEELGSENVVKRVEFKIDGTDTKSTTASELDEKTFQDYKTGLAASSEFIVKGRLDGLSFKDCEVSSVEQPGLTGRDFGYKYTFSCDTQDFADKPKAVKVQGVHIIIYKSDGSAIELIVDNAEPNKLSDETVDRIVKSLKFN